MVYILRETFYSRVIFLSIFYHQICVILRDDGYLTLECDGVHLETDFLFPSYLSFNILPSNMCDSEDDGYLTLECDGVHLETDFLFPSYLSFNILPSNMCDSEG